jgi:serine/threonine-protein kinase
MTGEDPRINQKQDRTVLNPTQRTKADPCEICGQPIQNEGHACLKDVPASTAALNDPKIGMVVGRHYEILSRIGEGGMSVVYKAKHQLLNKIVAIKVLKPVLAVDQIKLARFQQEAMSVYRLDHPNIIRVYHFEMPKHEPFLVMDYLDGKPLSEIIATQGRLPLERCVGIFTQVCSGMQHAHESGVIHRDIKPSNIIVSTDENGVDSIKIVDFGIAKVSDWEIVGGIQGVTQAGEVFGSPLYMSPEQCTAKHIDARSDIYSAACVMYECLTGEPPLLGATALDTMQMHVFDVADNVSAHVPDLPNAAKVDAVMFKALAKHPDRRYQSMAEFQDALDSLIEKKPPPTILEEAKTHIEVYQRRKDAKQSRMNPISIGLITLCTIMFVVCAALIYQYFSASTQVKDWQQANVTAQKLFDRGKLGEAQGLFEKALQLASKEGPDKRTARVVASLESLVDVTRCQGKDPAKYVEQLKQAKLQDNSLNQNSAILAELKKYSDTAGSSTSGPAEDAAVRATATNNATTGSASTTQSDADRLCQRANDEALVEIQNSEFQNAETLLQSAYQTAQKLAPNSVSAARSLHNLGYLKMMQDKPTEAMPYFKKSTALAQKLDDKTIIAADLQATAGIDLNGGDYAQAKEAVTKAMNIYRTVSGAASRDSAQCHKDLGNIAMAQGAYSDAESEFNEAINLTQNLPADQKNARDLAEYRQRLEQLYTFGKIDPTKSRSLLNQIIAEQEALESKNLTDWKDLGDALTDLADLDDATGSGQESLPLSERAIAIAQRIGEPNNSLYARALFAKAKAEWSQRSPLAEKTLIAAINAYLNCYGKDSPEVGKMHQELGRMYMRQKEFPLAEGELQQSIDIFSKTNQGDTATKRKESMELLHQALAAQNKGAEQAEIRKLQQQQ